MKITIIIPNYNGRHFMKACLESLDKQSIKDFDILVIDNCSSDGSLEYMEEKYPNVKVIPQDKNYGFSHAVNVGIRIADTPYVILLNNDTFVGRHFVEEMLKAIERSKNIFSVSSKMIQMHQPELIDSAGDLYTLIGWAVCRGAGRPVTEYTKMDRIFSACAGAAIYRREVFEEIGDFDESHFAYLEDVDIGYRAKIHGYDNIFCPYARVYHVGSGTSGSKYNSFKVRLSARNSIYLNYKNMPILQLTLNFVPLLMGYIIKYLFFCKNGYGKDYKEGLLEGLRTYKQCRKVRFRPKNLWNYADIEYQLFVNTCRYAHDWFKRKLSVKNS